MDAHRRASTAKGAAKVCVAQKAQMEKVKAAMVATTPGSGKDGLA